jgi:hypothetical protein
MFNIFHAHYAANLLLIYKNQFTTTRHYLLNILLHGQHSRHKLFQVFIIQCLNLHTENGKTQIFLYYAYVFILTVSIKYH